MPILLDTPISPGDLDSAPYTHVKIYRFELSIENQPRINFSAEYGVLESDGSWSPAPRNIPRRHYEIMDKPRRGTTEYTDMLATAKSTAAGQGVYDLAGLHLYSHILPEFPGVIVV